MSKRIPFNIKYRPQIESGEYTLETRDGRLARVLCWDRAAKEDQPKDLNLCILIQEDGGEGVYYYYPDGTKWVTGDNYDLFIVTPKQEEPDLTGFESGLFTAFSDAWQQYLLGEEVNVVEWTKEHSAELLSLAREQLKPDINLMLEDNYKTAYKEGYDEGRVDALKDLPRWKKIGQGNNYWPETKFCINGRYLEMNDTLNRLYEIALKNLEKLPRED